MSVLPRRIRIKYQEDFAFFKKQENDSLISYDEIVNCLEKMENYILSAYFTHDKKKKEKTSDDESTITLKRAIKTFNQCLADLKKYIVDDPQKALKASETGCRLAMQFDIGDIWGLTCFSYFVADTKGYDINALTIARKVYEKGKKMSKNNMLSFIPYQNGLSKGKVQFLTIADTYAWALHVNGFSNEAYQIIEECYKAKKDGEFVVPHYNKIKKAAGM